MSVLATITAAATQSWNVVSTFAVVNSQWLLTSLGFGASPIALQAAVLMGVALVSLGVIALSLYVGSKVLGKIFKKPVDPIIPVDDKINANQDNVPDPIIATPEAQELIAAADKAITARNNVITARNNAILSLTVENPGMANIVTLSKAAVVAAEAAFESAKSIENAVLSLTKGKVLKPDDPLMLQAQEASIRVVESRKELLRCSLYEARATVYHTENSKLEAAYNAAYAAYDKKNPEPFNKANEAWTLYFNVIPGKLKAIDGLNDKNLKKAFKGLKVSEPTTVKENPTVLPKKK